MAAVVNTTWYTNYGNGSSTGYYAVTKWAAGATNTVGNIIRQNSTPSVDNERCFVCIVAGTSANPTEPTWTVTKGGKTTDNSTTWMECTGLPALNADLTNTPLSSSNRSAAQVLGNLITNNTQDHYFICTTAGTTGSGEPSYNTTTGVTTTDSGCTWTCLGAVTSFTTKWGAPHARMLAAVTSTWAASGDTVYVSSIHAETQAASYNLNPGNTALTKFICVSNTGNIPPQSADVTTGATSTVTNSFVTLDTQGWLYIQGISFTSSGQGSSFSGPIGSVNYMRMANCAINTTGPSSASSVQFNGNQLTKVELDNVTIELNGIAGSNIEVGANFVWKDTPSALSKNGTNWPTTLFSQGTSNGTMWIENVDLSAFAGTQYFGASEEGARWVLNKCKISSAPIATIANMTAGESGFNIDVIDCDSGGNTYRHERWNYQGNQVVSTTAVYTGGATNGTTSYSWQVLPSANAQWLIPFECLPMAIWNTTTGANRTVTVQGVYNGAALPNNDEIWLEVSYFGTSSSTLGTRVTETKANFVAAGSALTANTSAAWNSAATARANTTSYSVGNLISVSTASAGQLYICTQSGTSAGSVPGGYATNADGSTVTDGTAHFLAMVRFYMQVVCTSPTPQSAGYLNCYVKAAKASAQYFVDPNPTLS